MPKAGKPKADEALKEHVLDLLSPMGGVTVKYMFGGWGFSQKGIFFGLIADGRVFFKVSDATRPKYEAEGSQPFTYSRDGKTMAMGYFEVPDGLLEDGEGLRERARESVREAVNGKKGKK